MPRPGPSRLAVGGRSVNRMRPSAACGKLQRRTIASYQCAQTPSSLDVQFHLTHICLRCSRQNDTQRAKAAQWAGASNSASAGYGERQQEHNLTRRSAQHRIASQHSHNSHSRPGFSAAVSQVKHSTFARSQPICLAPDVLADGIQGSRFLGCGEAGAGCWEHFGCSYSERISAEMKTRSENEHVIKSPAQRAFCLKTSMRRQCLTIVGRHTFPSVPSQMCYDCDAPRLA